MKWFGEHWGAPICDNEHVEVPTEPCVACEMPFKANDRGIILPFAGLPEDPPELPYHHRCLMVHLGIASEVHVLHEGLALCGFGHGTFPVEWPGKHSWVRIAEAHDKATCPECLREVGRRSGSD